MPGRHSIRASALPLAMAFAAFHAAAAQSTTSLQTDATVLPRRSFSVGVLTSWTRFDELLGNGGQRNIASSFNVDSLTGAQIPGLPTTSLVQAATGNSNLQVTAGNITAAANARVVVSPLIVQYGLTRRLTLGVVVPLVQTRTTFIAGLNQHGIAGNVGLNPGLITGSWSQNAAVVGGLQAAAQALAATLRNCQATPAEPACQNQAAANALNATATLFASTLGSLYGTGQNAPGTTFVPVAGSNIQQAIQGRLDRIATAYQSFNTSFVKGTLQAATAPANAVLNAVLVDAGYDTLQSPDRSSIGDISVGATYQLANSYPDSVPSAGFHRRISINATGRIGTGEPANRNRLFDNPTGYGQPGLILGGAADLAWGTRVGLSALGSYTMQFGSIDVSRVPNTAGAALPLTDALGGSYSAGNVLALTAMPRIRLGGFFSVNGIYALTRVAADRYTAPPVTAVPDPAALESLLLPVAAAPFGNAAATLQQIGLGFSYSTAQTLRGPGRIPAEVAFRHLETVSVSGGPAAKTFEDQISVRFYLR